MYILLVKIHYGGLMTFNTYQKKANVTAKYPKQIGLIYTALGLNGEAGEIAEKIKKHLRDKIELDKTYKEELAKELGDVLWYLSAMAGEIGYKLDEIADMNIKKLFSRFKRGKISGSGDNR